MEMRGGASVCDNHESMHAASGMNTLFVVWPSL
jgi:hypothetical protein